MVQKEHLLNKFIILLFCQLIFSCSETANKKSDNIFLKKLISASAKYFNFKWQQTEIRERGLLF
jgi:hypothetical protein